MRRSLSAAVLLYAALLAGCATQIEPPVPQTAYHIKSWKQRKLNLAEKTCWNLQGAVSVQSQQKTQLGSFTWNQMNQYYTITISGPLNIGSLYIQGDPRQVTLYKPSGMYKAPTAEALMQAQLGWYLPISNMYFWIRGLPAPRLAGRKAYDSYGHLIFLQQQGWEIYFQAFQPHGTIDLPRKIIMANQQLRVKLVINHWDIYDR
jgi:outer membrane lipoprotein LolB